MDSVLHSWLLERMGLDCVPKVEDFCKYMADGTLLAELLHSYGIIDTQQKDLVLPSDDPWTRLENLKYLMTYLRPLKIKADEYMLVKITKEDQDSAVILLYKLYSKLEPISTLRLEVEQKEREVSGKYPPRFTVSKVQKSEVSSRAMMSVNPLISPLNEKSSIIAWHRAKYEQILNTLKENRKRVAARIGKVSVEKGKGDSESSAVPKPSQYEATQEGIEWFAQKCNDEEENDISISQLAIEQVRGEWLSKDAHLDSEKIRDHIPYLRRKIKREEVHRKIKKSIEKVLLSEAWEKLTKEQESDFDSLITKKLLKQSQYEKQILSKLHDIRDEKLRFIKNRTFVQNLIFKENEAKNENKWIHELTKSADKFKQEERRKLIHIDYQRKLDEEIMRLKKEECTRTCKDAISDMIDTAIKSSDFVTKNGASAPQKMWDEWKVLFIKSQPIFDILENIEDILEPEGDEDFEAKRQIESQRQHVLDEADFLAYMEMKGPWLLEELCPELGVLLEAQATLGYIVYRILDSKYPTCPKVEVDLPPTKVAVCLIGLEDEETLAMLQSLLDTHQVKILQLKYIIEYFICAYQMELSKVGAVDKNLIIATERTKAELTGKKYEPPEKKDGISEGSRPASKSSKDSITIAEEEEEEENEKIEKKSKKGKKKAKDGKEKEAKGAKKIQLEDKGVQTDDEKYKVELTPKASLGKMAFETLAIGEKIDDTLMTRMLVEYIKNYDLSAWVLIDYPENFSQAKLMEEALVGVRLPSEDEVIETLETLEGVEVREIEEYKPMRKKGCSRLVPNTFGSASCDFPKSFLTAYITLEKKTILKEGSQASIDNGNEECSEVERKSTNVLDESLSEKQYDFEMLQRGRASLGFTISSFSKRFISTFDNYKASKNKASELNIKVAQRRIQKKDAASFENGCFQTAETENLAEELGIMSKEETGGETIKEDIIGQEIEEEKGLRALDKFYLNQGISYKFYYQEFDLQTLKNLARMIIGDSDDTEVASVELFGTVVEELEEYLTKKSEAKDVTWTIKKLVSPEILAKAEEEEKKKEKAEQLEAEEKRVQESKANEKSTKKEKKKKGKKKKEKQKNIEVNKSEQTMEKASEEEWSGEAEELQEPEMPPEPKEEVFMNFYIPQELLVMLATMWENLEDVYIRDLKEAFFMKRIYDAAIFPYAAFVRNNILNLIKGADSKQIFVHDFQMQFNAIDGDLRSDVEMKSELHARVYELRMALYDIADGHKFDVESERQRIIRTNWVTEHMAAITNIFLIFIQLEADRFVDTLQILQDYYMGMLDKPPAETTMEKVMVTRIELSTPLTTPPEYGSEEDIEELLKGPSAEDVRVTENQPEIQTKVRDKSRSKSKIVIISEQSSIAELQRNMKTGKDTKMIPDSENAAEIPKSTVNIVSDEQKKPIVQEYSGDIAKNFIENLLIDVEADSTSQSPFHSVISDTVEKITPIMESYIKKQLDIIRDEESAFGKTNKKGKKWKDRDTSPEAELKKAQMIELHAMSDNFFEEWRTVLDSEAERAKARLQLILKRGFQDLDDIIQWAKSLFHGLHEQIAARYKGEIAAVDEMCKVFCNAIEDERNIQEELVIDGDDFFIRPCVLMFPRPSPEEPPPIEEPYQDNTFRVEQLKRLLEIFRIAAPSGLMPERALCYILEDLIMCRYEGHELPPLWYQLTSSEIPELLEAIFGKVEYVEWREFIIRALGLSYPSMRQVLKMREEFHKYDSRLKECISCDAYNKITLWFEKNVPEDEVTQLHIRLAKKLLYNMFEISDSQFGYMTFLLNFCKDREPKRGLAKAFALNLGKAVVASDDEYKLYQQLLEERRKELNEVTSTAKDILWDVTNDAVQSASGIILKEVLEKVEEKAFETEEQKQTIEQILEYAENEVDEEEQQENETEEAEQGKEKTPSDDRTEVLFKTSLSSGSTHEEEFKNLLNAAVKVPVEVLVNVLTTSLPWHGKAENVLEAGEKSLLIKLDQVCDELADENNCVSIHEFLSHTFTCDLLNTTHKFHAFYLEEKLELIFVTKEFLESLCDQAVELSTR